VANDDEVTATFENRRWVFPRADCVLLPIANTTAELLARHIAERLLADLGGPPAITTLEVSVDECQGQLATFCWSTP
jgi:6-pyruvoyltetrahydropterin/6-carboxytetrahydropterin synthase